MSLDSCPPSFKIVKLGSVDQERNAINAGFQAILRCMEHSMLPNPTGHAGEFLTTPDGVTVEWATIPSGGGVESIVAGTNISVDNTDPANPIISASVPSSIASVVAGDGIGVDNSDPENPIVSIDPDLTRSCITFGWDGAGVALVAGQVLRGRASYPLTITDVTVLADSSGSCVIDIWKDTFTNYPPTAPDSITGAAPPTLTASNKSYNTTLTGWTTAVNTGDTFICRIASISGGVTQLNITLGGTRA